MDTDERSKHLPKDDLLKQDKANNFKKEEQCIMFTFAKCVDEKKHGYCNRFHNILVKKAKLAIELNPEITDSEMETILNGDVELTDQNREGIVNSASW